jgi:hypothetical protein
VCSAFGVPRIGTHFTDRYKNIHRQTSFSFPFPWHNSPNRAYAVSFLEVSRPHSFRHTTLGMTPLDEWSARRRDLYLTTHKHSQETNIHAPGGIRTRDPSNRWHEIPRLRPRDHWGRLWVKYSVICDCPFYFVRVLYRGSKEFVAKPAEGESAFFTLFLRGMWRRPTKPSAVLITPVCFHYEYHTDVRS